MNQVNQSHALPLSVAIVCMNNESTIGRTLESVRGLASEIVAVDSGSTDGTIELLNAAGARVIHQQWLGHIKQKQMAFDACEQPWVLHMDSDESLEPALQASVRAAMEKNDPSIAGFEVNRKVWWKGAFLNHAWQPEWRLRLVRAETARWGGYDPHDALEIIDEDRATRRVERLSGDMRHDSFVSMRDHLAAQVKHSEVAAESYLEMGRRGSVWKLISSPVGAWLKQMTLKQAWRDGWRGWSAASATAAAALMKHLILLERSRDARSGQSERPGDRRRGGNESDGTGR